MELAGFYCLLDGARQSGPKKRGLEVARVMRGMAVSDSGVSKTPKLYNVIVIVNNISAESFSQVV